MSAAQEPPSRTGLNDGAHTEPQAALQLLWHSVVARFAHLRGSGRSDELRREMRRVIEAQATAAAERVVSGQPDEDDAARLDELQKLLAALPRWGGDLAAAFVVAILCLLLASITLIHTPTTAVDLAVKASAVQLRLAAPLAWPDWQVGSRAASTRRPASAVTLLSNVNQIDLPPEFDRPDSILTRASLTMEGGRATLQDLKLSPGVVVTLTRDLSGAIDLLLLNRLPAGVRDSQGVSGNFVIAGDAVLTATGEGGNFAKRLRDTDEPVRVPFSDDGAGTVPVALRFYPAESVTLPRLQIDQLSLAPNESANFEEHQSFTSAISEGSMFVPDTREVTDLKGADITLTGATGYISGLEITSEGIEFSFEGEAKKISIGPQPYTRYVRVSWLEYLYSRDKFKAFWLLIGALWGIVWGVRKIMGSR